MTAKSTAQDNANGIFLFRTDAPFNASDFRTYPERLQIRVHGSDLRSGGLAERCREAGRDVDRDLERRGIAFVLGDLDRRPADD